MDVIETPWVVIRGTGNQGQSVLGLLPENSEQPILITDQENPALFNHIAYLHNKSLQSETEDATCSEGQQ